MESIPSQNSESQAEKICTKEEVLSIIVPNIEGSHTVTRELSDEKGLYLLEVQVAGAAGETIEYNYTRKGRHQTNIQASETTIEITYYQDGQPVSGTTFARFNPENGSWDKV